MQEFQLTATFLEDKVRGDVVKVYFDCEGNDTYSTVGRILAVSKALNLQILSISGHSSLHWDPTNIFFSFMDRYEVTLAVSK